MNDLADILPGSGSVDGLFASEVLQKILASSLLDPVSEFLSRPAKNIRSELVDLGFRLSQANEPENIPDEVRFALLKGSSIVELIHSGSLIVDDIQDSSLVRRNAPALHVVHGVPLALNAGNWLYFWALDKLKHLDLEPLVRQAVTDDVLSLMMKAHAGQALDVGTRIDLLPKENVKETTLASLELKSGTLMSLALRIGAGIGGTGEKVQDIFHLGSTLGVLLQIYDDIGNFLADTPKKFEDLRNRRPSWIWAMASEYPAAEYKKFIHAVTHLPDEKPLKNWIEKNNFKEKLYTETEMIRNVCEAYWRSEWEKTHPHSFNRLMEINKKLERAYV